MHNVASHGNVSCVRSKDAQKQLEPTPLQIK